MTGKIIYGLIGYPLEHSFSEDYFKAKFIREDIRNTQYRTFPLGRIARLEELLTAEPDLCGFNVTAPYKESIIGYLDHIDPVASRIGAVNCVKVEWVDGKIRMIGYNTDAAAFSETLLAFTAGNPPAEALILGAGGASKAAQYVLGGLGVGYTVASRSGRLGTVEYGNLSPDLVAGCRLIVNTTILGTWPDCDSKPDIPYAAVTAGHFAYDMVYNPPQTSFLRECHAQGANTTNGQKMLERQAQLSWEIWQNN